MKQSFAIAALAALIAWPATGEAAGKKKTLRHKASPVATKARAHYYAYGPGYRRPHSPNPAWDVYWNDGVYAGSDPDPLIRDMLRRDDLRNIGHQ